MRYRIYNLTTQKVFFTDDESLAIEFSYNPNYDVEVQEGEDSK